MLSKLSQQLDKQNITHDRNTFDENRYLELYTNICKTQPKNLTLLEYLLLIIEKGFIKNLHRLNHIVDLFQQLKQQKFTTDNKTQIQGDKVNKNKFLELMKILAKNIYPGDPNAYKTVFLQKITGVEVDDPPRIKMEQSLKKCLTYQVISILKDNQKYMQAVFQVYLPQNFNNKLGFTIRQIKMLEKKLPIICFLRFLYETEVFPHYLTAGQFIQIISKLIPPLPMNLNPKQSMFYYMETFNNYIRDYISMPTIKLLEGDIGLSFFEFQMLFCRFSIQFSKQSKQQYTTSLKKLLNFTKLKQIILGQTLQKQTKAAQSIKNHFHGERKPTNKFNIKKKQSRKKFQDLFDFNDQHFDENFKLNEFEDVHLTPQQFQNFKNSFNVLPPIPPPKPINKQNQQPYDINVKHVVIGQQLPKIQQKNKPIPPKEQKKKSQSKLLGYEPQVEKEIERSQDNFSKLLKRNKKIRINNQFPIILTQILYPSCLPNFTLSSASQIYLQTTYIYLGQRYYQKAFINFRKCKALTETKSIENQVFFYLLQAQIFQAAGKDQGSLKCYFKAKSKLFDPQSSNFPFNDNYLSFTLYNGLGSALYHIEQYQYAYRCFLKAKQIRGKQLELQSIQNAFLQNNFGCCLMMLNRNKQAIPHFQLSQNLLDLKVGKFDERTLVAQQNISKNKKAYIQMMPQFKTMWRTYVQKTNHAKSSNTNNNKNKN